MSSKKKLLRKIMAGIIEVPEGWGEIVKAATVDANGHPMTITTVVQEDTTETTEITAAVDTTPVEMTEPAPIETTEALATAIHRDTKELTERTSRKNASKTRQTRTTTTRTTTKRNRCI